MSEEYKGWSNYKTWLVVLWLRFVEERHGYWQRQAEEVIRSVLDENTCEDDLEGIVAFVRPVLAARLSDWLKKGNPLIGQGNLYVDLLQQALSEVDTEQIAQFYLKDAFERKAVTLPPKAVSETTITYVVKIYQDGKIFSTMNFNDSAAARKVEETFCSFGYLVEVTSQTYNPEEELL
jgi:hypothetical protein